MASTLPDRPHQRGGFALIEVMVSALIAVPSTGAGSLPAQATGRAGAEDRHRAKPSRSPKKIRRA